MSNKLKQYSMKIFCLATTSNWLEYNRYLELMSHLPANICNIAFISCYYFGLLRFIFKLKRKRSPKDESKKLGTVMTYVPCPY